MSEENGSLAEDFERLARLGAQLARVPLAGIYRFDGDRATLLGSHGPAILSSPTAAARLTVQKTRTLQVAGATSPAEFALIASKARFTWMAIVPLGAAGEPRGALLLADSHAPADAETLSEQLKDLRTLMEDHIDRADAELVRSMPGARRPVPASGRSGLDSVTGLPLRSLAIAECERRVARAEVLGGRFTVLAVELDRFRRVNESLGSAAGDALLRQVGERLRQAVSEGDVVARRSGDEFLIIAQDNGKSSALLAHGIRASFSDPFHHHGTELSVTASVGFASYPANGEDAATLLRNADIALAHAKQRGSGNSVEFDPSMENAVRDRSEIERELRTALRDQNLTLHYQPKHMIADRKLCGLEALVRWTHPRLGPIPPIRFIPIAEETGLIVPLGAWCLGEACRQRRRWADQGVSVGPLSVNVSAIQFARTDFVGTVRRAIVESKIDPSWLEIELTESVVMDDVDTAIERLTGIRNLGVRISVDDFGTGYSSLAYLSRLPVDVLKIDRTFVRDLDAEGGTGKQANAIAKTVSYLGKALDLEVLAEGVETEAQLAKLSECECDAVQGYLFSKPLAVPDADRYFKNLPSSAPS